MSKKTSTSYFITILNILITITPTTVYAVKAESTPITRDCSTNPENAEWVQIFFSNPNAKASLRTDGLLFKTNAWRSFSNNQPSVQYLVALGETHFRDIAVNAGPAVWEIQEVSFTGVDTFRYNDPPLSSISSIYAWFPHNSNHVDIQAACTISDILPGQQATFSNIAQPATTLAAAAKEHENFAIMVNMWPKDREISCDKSQGIAIKFSKPNNSDNTSIRYFGTLTILRDEKKSTEIPVLEVNASATAKTPIPQTSLTLGSLTKRSPISDYSSSQ